MPVQLRIAGIVAQAHSILERVSTDLPAHEGLKEAVQLTESAALKAERLSAQMKRPWSPHRLPVVFLGAALLFLAAWLYWQFLHVSTLSLALPNRDATMLRRAAGVGAGARVSVSTVDAKGSREAADMVARGMVDLAFVQGGIPISPELLRLETPGPEVVLFFMRPGVEAPRVVLTSLEGEGSHTVAQAYFEARGHRERGPLRFVYGWADLTLSESAGVPPEVDAVFVVKDPADELASRGVAKAIQAGFRLISADIGARAERMDFLRTTTLPRGYVLSDPPVPAEATATYAVPTFLVARAGLTPRLLGQAAEILEAKPRSIAERGMHWSTGETSEVFQGVDAFLSILLNVGLAFLALLGLDAVAYRRPFHELNSLVSVISMLQANKDVLGVRDPTLLAERLLYLGLCSDVLTLISAIGGYYTQENSSLLFNNLSHLVHSRCDALKLNIQLKILHASIAEVGPGPTALPGSPQVPSGG